MVSPIIAVLKIIGHTIISIVFLKILLGQEMVGQVILLNYSMEIR
jgi:hypothetical protein